MERITTILIVSLTASMLSLPLLYGDEKGGLKEIELSVQGMTSDQSVAKVKSALEAVEGVTSVKVELKEGEVDVHVKKSVDPQKLVSVLEKTGFKAEIEDIEEEFSKERDVKEVELSVQGMTSSESVTRVKNALQAVGGVISMKAEPKEGEVDVHVKKSIDPQKLVSALEKAGFKAKIEDIEDESY
ncbi:MAG TPA: cation transporter [Candidatus Hypogeohydataceae bacterium YC41]